LTQAAIRLIINVLDNCAIRFLNLSRNQITHQEVLRLAAILPDTRIEQLALDQIQLDVLSLERLCDTLCHMNRLIRLDVSLNALTDQAIPFLVRLIRTTKLEVLHVQGNNITTQGFIQLGEAIRESSWMKELHIRNNHTEKAALAPFIRCIRTHLTLKKVMCSNNTITVQDQDQLNTLLTRLHTMEAEMMTILCSVFLVHRIARHSPFRRLSTDLCQAI
jgi:Ran GTPase-activating protein (RanGAP) involved in mRNA processing and transport